MNTNKRVTLASVSFSLCRFCEIAVEPKFNSQQILAVIKKNKKLQLFFFINLQIIY